MLRGDDIYVLDFWPLDNLNTIGAGLRFDAETHTSAQIHFGVAQPNNGFFVQEAQRPEPLNQFGAATVKVLDRLRYTGSAKLEQLMFFGDQGAGMKLAGYGEVHQVPAGQRETDQEQVFETLPHENGWVVGGQIGAFTGKRNTHVNLFARYARGIAAYGEFENPQGLDADMSVNDAHEMRVAAGGNFEVGPFTMMVAGYLRSFRNASGGLDFGDLDEGIVIARPHIFFTDWLGLALEGSFQAQQRGVLIDDAGERGEVGDAEPSPLFARIGRVAAIPFVTLGGRGSYSRPMFWFTYMATFRDEDARALYPVGDVLRNRKTDHFIGITAEWWFGSTSYGGTWK
jgi:maltoporin